MVNSIGGSSMIGMHRPGPQDFFQKVDSDSSGGISQAELKTLSDNLQKMTGKTLDASDEAFSSYDSNGDGSLSSDELKSVLDQGGFGPPSGAEGMAPPPPSQDQATASYAANSGDDSLSALITNLQSLIDKLSSKSDSTDSSSTDNVSTAQAQRPDPKDFFKKVDTDGSGDISKSELKNLAEDMKNNTGTTIDTSNEAFNTYDTNGDGVLSQDELKGVMDKNRPTPPHGHGEGMRTQTASNEQTSSTAVNMQDQLSVLRDLLNKLTNIQSSNNDSADSLLSITT
jgi:Ca2+-binding EF-hand superfamily protein